MPVPSLCRTSRFGCGPRHQGAALELGIFSNTDYLSRGMSRTVKRWLAELAEPPSRGPGKGGVTRKKPAEVKGNPGKSEKPKKPPAGKPPAPGITDEMKERLRSRLGDIKRKVQHGAGEVAPEEEEGEGEPAVIPSSEQPVMTTGTAMVPAAAFTVEKKAKTRREKGNKEEDTRGSTTKCLSAQLIARAVATSRKRKETTRKSKKSKKESNSALVSLLGELLNDRKSRKDKKERKKKKKKKKRRRTLKDGVIVSSSTSSSNESSPLEASSESDQDLEAPMRRKSRDHPGSVLSMLTEHVRDVMEQAALTDVPMELQQVTSGVKVASYFARHVKPHFPLYQRELREMYMLAATIDLLRAGDVARVGDSLAARFMAILQSMLDQGWAIRPVTWGFTAWTIQALPPLPSSSPQGSTQGW